VTSDASATSGRPRLGVDLTPAGVSAVLDLGGPVAQPLLWDGSPCPAATVFVEDDGTLSVGSVALTDGVRRPERLVPEPLALAPDPFLVDAISVDPIGAGAALLAQVAGQARDVIGANHLEEVILGVPPSWGPGRRTRLRRAAAQAGLRPVRIVDTAIAVATEHVNGPGSVLLVRHDGNYSEATVLHRHSDSVEVLAAIDNQPRPDIDPAALAAQALTAADIDVTALSGAYCLTNDPTALGPLARRLGETLGMPVTPLAGGAVAAAAAIARVHRPASMSTGLRPNAGLAWAALRIVVPSIAAVILLAQGIGGTDVYGENLRDTLVIAEWSAFITASVCTVLAAAAAAVMMTGIRPGLGSTVMFGALSATTALSVLYSLIAAGSAGAPVSAFLPWTIVPALGVAASIGIAALAARAVNRPARVFPFAALCLLAGGVMAMAAANVNIPATPRWMWPILLRVGAALVGVAIAFLITTRRRWLLAPPLAATLAVVAGLNTTRTIAILAAVSIGLWWLAAAIRDVLTHPAVAALFQVPAEVPYPNGEEATAVEPPPVAEPGSG
jgi:hypothetical protein